jgi:enolase-like protein
LDCIAQRKPERPKRLSSEKEKVKNDTHCSNLVYRWNFSPRRETAGGQMELVPHLWKTGISIAAAVHFAAATPHVAFLEFLPKELCELPLRKELVIDETQMVDGVIPLPTRPGLGIELNRPVLERFKQTGSKISASR